ncbi:Inorganic pyrophosphatase [Halioglobus japonicus]|nr:Inorganic pyrophosphatase [Halioglobus japonicus]
MPGMPDSTYLSSDAPSVEVVIEISRGSFLKRDGKGRVAFVSPVPCPYNYGSVHAYIGGEGDYLDAVVLGPRLPVGSIVKVNAYGAVGLSERAMYDDKLICASHPISASDRRNVLLFFRLYASFKGILNSFRGRGGRSRCEGWGDAKAAIARAVPVSPL